MRRKNYGGSTSNAIPIRVQDTSSTTGGGLSGLVYNTSGLVAEYRREGSSSWTSISLVAGTLGTYVGGGFVADGALAGAYEFCPPDAAIASGKRWVVIRLYGVTNMFPVLLEIELDKVNYQSNDFGLSLAKTTNITGFNDIAETSIVSSGAITTSGGAVSTVTTVSGGNVNAATIAGVTPLFTGQMIQSDVQLVQGNTFSTYTGVVPADVQKVSGSTAAATALSAQSLGSTLAAVSSDASPTTTRFTANTTGSPALKATTGWYSTPNSLIVFYTGTLQGKTTYCTNYTASGGVGTFTLGAALPSAPSAADQFFIISTR